MTFTEFKDGMLQLRYPYGISNPSRNGYLVVSVFKTIIAVLTKPHAYPASTREPWFVSPFFLLALVFLLSLQKFSRDPMIGHIVSFTGFNSYVVGMTYMVSASLTTVLGAYWIPRFWHHVLGIRIDRTTFILAMMSVFAAVAIPSDLTSWIWMRFVNNGTIPIWLPDTVRTIIVTVYSWLCGKSLEQAAEHGN